MRDRPGIEIELLDIDIRNVHVFVETGQADLGIASRSLSGMAVAFEPLFRDRFKVVCRADSDLANAGRPVQWTDLQGENLILNGASSKIDAPAFRRLSEGVSMEVRNVTSLLALARSGFGITLILALTANELPDGVVSLDLADEDVWRVVGLLSRSNAKLSPVASAFRAFALAEPPKLLRSLGLEVVDPRSTVQ